MHNKGEETNGIYDPSRPNVPPTLCQLRLLGRHSIKRSHVPVPIAGSELDQVAGKPPEDIADQELQDARGWRPVGPQAVLALDVDKAKANGQAHEADFLLLSRNPSLALFNADIESHRETFPRHTIFFSPSSSNFFCKSAIFSVPNFLNP